MVMMMMLVMVMMMVMATLIAGNRYNGESGKLIIMTRDIMRKCDQRFLIIAVIRNL